MLRRRTILAGALALGALASAGCSAAGRTTGFADRGVRRIDARQAAFIDRIVRSDPGWRTVLVPASKWSSEPPFPAASDAGMFRTGVWVRGPGADTATSVACPPTAIRVTGAVARPSTMEWPEGLSLAGAIEQCGGVEGEAGTFVLVARRDARHGMGQVACAQFADGDGRDRDPRQNLDLRAGDLVVVLRASSPARAAEEAAPVLAPLRAYLNGEISQAAFPDVPAAVAERRGP